MKSMSNLLNVVVAAAKSFRIDREDLRLEIDPELIIFIKIFILT